MSGLMKLPSPPTAVLALNLGISTGVLLDRIDNQRQLAYISLDETELSAGLHISAVVRDPEEVGRQAALLAIARVAEPGLPARTVTLSSHLIKTRIRRNPSRRVHFAHRFDEAAVGLRPDLTSAIDQALGARVLPVTCCRNRPLFLVRAPQ